MHASLVLLGTLLMWPGADGRPAVKTSSDSVTLSHCLITLNEEASVPAKEMGALVKITVKDGAQVVRGQVLAQIDDVHVRMELQAAEYKYKVAKEESENDINARFSDAAGDVAHAQVLTGDEANRRVSGSVTESQMREWRLTEKKFRLEAEQARFKMHTDGLEAMVRLAEMDAAKESMERRQIKAPLDGIVVDLKKHEGEWVQAGDTLLRIMRIDTLRIEGFLKASEYSRGELERREVTVSVELPRGRKEVFRGKVEFAEPQIDASGEFRVRVVVFNRMENDYWLLYPGMTAEMTIHLK